jgi:hypothetical protein
MLAAQNLDMQETAPPVGTLKLPQTGEPRESELLSSVWISARNGSEVLLCNNVSC